MRRYISENGTDSNQCGQTVETACKTMTPVLEQSHTGNSFVDPDLLDKVDNVWAQVFNQIWIIVNDTDNLIPISYPSPTLMPENIQFCTEERTVNYKFFDDICNLIKDIYLSHIISSEDREYFSNGLDTYCIHRRNLYIEELDCSDPDHFYPLFGMFSLDETWNEMIEKLKSINVDILTFANIKMNNDDFPVVAGPYHFRYRFIPVGNDIIHIDILNNTFTKVHLQLDNSGISAYIKDNVFTEAGITISSTFTDSHQPVIIENNIFQGERPNTILDIITGVDVEITNKGQRAGMQKDANYFYHLNMISNDNITIHIVILNNTFNNDHPYHFFPYDLHFTQTSNQIININVISNKFNNIHLKLDNSRMSAHIKDNVFTESGIKIFSTSTDSHQPVIVENNVFQGYNSETILEVRNTTNIIISSCIFKNAKLFVSFYETFFDKTESAMLCYNSQIEMHDIMLKNVSFAPVATFENCTLSIYNVTMFKNNLSSFMSVINPEKHTLLHIKYSEGTFKNIKFENNRRIYCIWIDSGNVTFQNMVATGNNDVTIGRARESNIHFDKALVFNNTGSFFSLYRSTINISSCILKHNNNSFRERITFVNSNVFISDTVFEDNEGDTLIRLDYQTEFVVSKSRFLLNRIMYSLFSIHFLERFESYYIVKKIVINDSEFNDNQRLIECEDCQYHSFYSFSGVVAQLERRSIQFTNCSFSNNVASNRAGILLAILAEVALFNCTFTNNTAHNEAGAIDLHHCSLLVKNSTFINNSCGVEGGVISAYWNSTLEVSNSIFKNNKALGADGGAIFVEDESNLKVDSCEFIGNTAALGGGAVMVIDHSSYADTGSTFTNNTAADNGKLTIYEGIVLNLS